jgi:hypothetical protein
MTEYQDFLETKRRFGDDSGFDPVVMPDYLFDFQASLVDWAIHKGRAAIFADCGLGKTPMALVWAENVVRHTNGRVLILTPLAVGAQMIEEAAKFNIEAYRSGDGKPRPNITIANYERLHLFDPADFAGVVCDESSILKSFDGVRRNMVTEFLRTKQYRLLCTATAAPNDYVELGTSSEAVGDLGHIDMLGRYFKNDQNTSALGSGPGRFGGHKDTWRFKHHAEQPFWRWVCSWARACRKPSDLGFDDKRFILPSLSERETVVTARTPKQGMLFDVAAIGFREEREVTARTVQERCEAAAEKVWATGQPAVIWCHRNAEGDLLEKLIPDAQQVSGDDEDDSKEEKFAAFKSGATRVLITKPKIGAWGLNWEHCAHVVYFPSHSYEQYYQAVRRCWRFGQTRPVIVDLVRTDGDGAVLENLKRKSLAADKMFSDLVAQMNDAIKWDRDKGFTKKMEVPSWL